LADYAVITFADTIAMPLLLLVCLALTPLFYFAADAPRRAAICRRHFERRHAMPLLMPLPLRHFRQIADIAISHFRY
jgi:hypothetical protein